MSGDALDCRQARLRIPGYLEGADPEPGLEVHLGTCGACQEALVEAALRRPARVVIPAGFARRVAARVDVPPARSVFPHTVAAASVLFVVWGLGLITGEIAPAFRLWLEGWQARLPLALSLLGIETVAVLVWFWRVARA